MNRADGLIARPRDEGASEEIRVFRDCGGGCRRGERKRASGLNGMEMSVHERAARDGARSETDERDMTARGREEAARARREAGNRGGKKRVKEEWVPQRERKERKLLCEEESSANEGSERSAPLRSAPLCSFRQTPPRSTRTLFAALVASSH